MSSNKWAKQYGKPMISSDNSFFDILKNEILKVEERNLMVVITGLGLAIGFPSIPIRN